MAVLHHVTYPELRLFNDDLLINPKHVNLIKNKYLAITLLMDLIAGKDLLKA
jgi:hypothetical protein